MDDKRLVRMSKFLSKYLRHEPDALGLQLLPGGWVLVEALLAGPAERFPITRGELEEVVLVTASSAFRSTPQAP